MGEQPGKVLLESGERSVLWALGKFRSVSESACFWSWNGAVLFSASVVERLRGGQPWKAGLPGRAEVPAGGGQPGDGLS